MDLSSLSKVLIDTGLKQLGTAVAGPAGGFLVDMLGRVLGTEPEPAKIAKRIETDPAGAKAQLEDLESDPATAEAAAATIAYWQMRETQLTETGASYRAEIAGGEWYQKAWRPLFAFVWTLIIGGIGAAVVYSLFVGNFEVINSIDSLTLYFVGGFGVLGVYAGGRSSEKKLAMTGMRTPGILGAVLGGRR